MILSDASGPMRPRSAFIALRQFFVTTKTLKNVQILGSPISDASRLLGMIYFHLFPPGLMDFRTVTG